MTLPALRSFGSGSFTWPDTDDVVSFAYGVAPSRKGTNVQGGLIPVRDTAEGSFELRSNTLDGLAIGQSDGVGWASFTGKSTYLEPGWVDRVENHTFTAYFQDAAQVQDGVDAACFQVRDKDGELVDGMSLPCGGSTDSVPLKDGDVVVPAPPGGNRRK